MNIQKVTEYRLPLRRLQVDTTLFSTPLRAILYHFPLSPPEGPPLNSLVRLRRCARGPEPPALVLRIIPMEVSFCLASFPLASPRLPLRAFYSREHLIACSHPAFCAIRTITT